MGKDGGRVDRGVYSIILESKRKPTWSFYFAYTVSPVKHRFVQIARNMFSSYCKQSLYSGTPCHDESIEDWVERRALNLKPYMYVYLIGRYTGIQGPTSFLS